MLRGGRVESLRGKRLLRGRMAKRMMDSEGKKEVKKEKQKNEGR